MKLLFDAEFHTYDAFSFRELDFDKNAKMYKNATIEYEYEDTGWERIYISLHADGDENACRWALRDLLEDLMCSISTFKHYLVKELYDLFDYFHKDLWKDKNQNKIKMMSGNYSGTLVRLVMIGEEE
jgi:hypothetical protein